MRAPFRAPTRAATWLALALLLGALACRPQPSAELELASDPAAAPAEPSGLGEAATVFVEAANDRAPVVGPELDWTKVDDRFASLIQASGQDRTRVPYDDDHPWSGASEPMVTIVLFSDYQCPYCKKLDETLVGLQRQYGNDLRIVWRQMPLAMHPQARLAAKAVLAAHAQGMFAPMHEWLFANSRDLSAATIEAEAANLGLDLVRFRADLTSDWLERRVQDDEDLGKHVHVTGVPGFFVNGRKFSGAQPDEMITATIDEELALGRELVASGSSPREVWARILAFANPDPAAPVAAATTPKSSGPDASKRYFVDLKGVVKRGAKKPKVEILMCGDFDCPFSGKAVATLAQLETNNKGKLAIRFRHFPLAMHANARAAHRAAIAADRQGQFWAMWELLFTNRQARSTADLEGFATQLGLDLEQFRKDVADPDVDKQIDDDIAACQGLDVRATPTFFLNGRPLQGAQAIEKFQEVIDEEKAGKGPPAAAKP
ncbi:DsbA family protein [Nannocystaceae bacterium ST9]